MTEIITSSANGLFKTILKLGQSARARRDTQLTLLDGEHLLQMAYQAGRTFQRLLVAESSLETHGAVWRARCPDVPLSCFSDALFRQLAPVDSPTGIAALLTIPDKQDTQGQTFWLLLDTVQDPGNVGAILRTAAAAGVSDIWLSDGCADVWAPKVLRAGMGAHFSVALHSGTNLSHTASQFAGSVLATVLEEGSQSLYQTDLTGPCAFMIGNEGAGLAPELAALATQKIHIPMPGVMESLNAAVAAGICLFERVRQTGGGAA